MTRRNQSEYIDKVLDALISVGQERNYRSDTFWNALALLATVRTNVFEMELELGRV